MCPELAGPDNGMVSVNLNENIGGATATYECFPGYTLIGPSELVCQLVEGSDPVWSDEPPICCMRKFLSYLFLYSAISEENVEVLS